jgi:DNA-binding NtrC family response regulator
MARILLIDDDQSLLTALCVAFEAAKHPIVIDTATTAEHALRLMEHTDYDTIVSDFCMPGLNGIDFLKECKATRPDIPVRSLDWLRNEWTRNRSVEERRICARSKPVDANVFLSVVTRAILRREVRRAGFVEGQLFAAENQRISSRLKKIDDRLRSQIEDAEKDNPNRTSDLK